MKLITITGPSGVGKDTVARMLSELCGYKVLCSYTTRPKRPGEIDGVEHHFVEKCDVPRDKMLAYTKYGGYEYWTTVEQIGETGIYVVDEEGLKMLCRRFPWMERFSISVYASERTRLRRGVSQERINRDKELIFLPKAFFDYCVYNNGTTEALADEVLRIKYLLR